jgi:predicted ester cyclase
MAPTGKHMTMSRMIIFRIANGKLIEGWNNSDLLGMLQQLGTAPAPEQS